MVAAKCLLRWQWLVKGSAKTSTEAFTHTPLVDLTLFLPHLKTNPRFLPFCLPEVSSKTRTESTCLRRWHSVNLAQLPTAEADRTGRALS